jgi:hypothetical protein
VTSPVAKAWQERHPDLSVRLTHRLTPDDVERIVEALEVDGLEIYQDTDGWTPGPASIERIKAALCGGSEEDYR